MSAWLSRAAGAFRRPRAAREEPFEIVSSAGRTVEGMRTSRHQVVNCPVTGERLFVLPLDAYPLPRQSAETKAKPKSKSGGGPTSEGRPTPKSKPARPKKRAEPRRPILPSRERVASVGRAGVDAVRRGGTRVRRWFTPLRSIVLATMTVLAATAWFASQSEGRRQAEILLRTASEKAWEAVAEEDWATAREQFAKANRAQRTLDLDDVSLRAAAREMDAASKLLEIPLFDLPANADAVIAANGEAGWTREFDAEYAGRWIVVDTLVRETSDEDGRPTIVIEYPLSLLGDVPLDLTIDAEAFSRLEIPSGDADPLRIVFAAQLESMQRSDGPLPRWRLRLNSESAFTWVHFDTIGAVGLAPFEDDETTEKELKQVLRTQARTEGIRIEPAGGDEE